eukprot:38911-Chlamydomonas_euryale.AAC.11
MASRAMMGRRVPSNARPRRQPRPRARSAQKLQRRRVQTMQRAHACLIKTFFAVSAAVCRADISKPADKSRMRRAQASAARWLVFTGGRCGP